MLESSSRRAQISRAEWAIEVAARWGAVLELHADVPYPEAEVRRVRGQLLQLPDEAEDFRDTVGEVIAVAKRITVRAHNMIARDVEVPFEAGTQPILVFNSQRSRVSVVARMHHEDLGGPVQVVDHAGRPVPSAPTRQDALHEHLGRGAVSFRADVPSLGYRLYRMRVGLAIEAPTRPPDAIAPVRVMAEGSHPGCLPPVHSFRAGGDR